jgi:hypothetical protein
MWRGCIDHIFLTSALVGGEWSASRPCHFTPGERGPGTHCVGRSGRHGEVKILDPTGIRTATSQSSNPYPVAIPNTFLRLLLLSRTHSNSLWGAVNRWRVNFIHSLSSLQRTHPVSITRTRQLMLFKVIILYRGNRAKLVHDFWTLKQVPHAVTTAL